jgi:hypothetical protein
VGIGSDTLDGVAYEITEAVEVSTREPLVRDNCRVQRKPRPAKNLLESRAWHIARAQSIPAS